MTCEKIQAAFILTIAVIIAASAAYNAQDADIAGSVPRLLTAVSERNAQCFESTLGDAVADAARIYLAADIAIINGGDLVRNMPPGDISWGELRRIFAEDRVLAVSYVTPKELRAILEVGVSHIRLNEMERVDIEVSKFEGFPQISGFTFVYDATAPVGQRIREFRIDGESIDLDDESYTITLAATAFMLEGGYGMPNVGVDVISDFTLASVMAAYMNDGMDDYLDIKNRFRVMGTSEGLTSVVPAGIVIAAMLIYLAGINWKDKRFFDRNTNDIDDKIKRQFFTWR